MRINKRVLLKEESTPEGAPSSYFYRVLVESSGFFNPTGLLNLFYSATGGLYGGGQMPSYSYVIIGAPQLLLDLFDYNGDGLIGPNDQQYAQLLADEIIAYVEQGGSYADIPFFFANEFRENWQDLNEQFGLNLPDPNGFSQNLEGSDVPDAETAANQEGGISTFNLSHRFGTAFLGLYTVCYNIYFLSGNMFQGTDYIEQVIALGDLNGDGQLTGSGGSGTNYNSDGYIGMVVMALVSYMDDVIDFSSYDAFDIIDSDGGVLGFLTEIMFSPEAQETEAFGGNTVFDFLQMVFQRWVDTGLIDEIPTAPDGDGGQSDYERLIQLLSNYGEGGTNFQDLLQLLSTWGQGGGSPTPPTPPPTPPPPAAAP
jgi:hypothetical protein